MTSRLGLALAGALLAVITLGVSVASAHIGVWPQQSATDAFEKYTVRVPSERPSATIRVEVDMPEQVTFSRVLPKPGWKYETSRNAAGRVTSIMWSGGTIGAEEFDEFEFQARNGRDVGKVRWTTRQVYADGTVVAWDGPEGSDNEASVTALHAGAGGDTSHGGSASVEPPASPSVQADTPAVAAETAPSGGFTLALAGAAFAVGALSLMLSVVSLRRGR